MSCFLRNEIKLGSDTATILLAAGHSNEAYIIGQIVSDLTLYSNSNTSCILFCREGRVA